MIKYNSLKRYSEDDPLYCIALKEAESFEKRHSKIKVKDIVISDFWGMTLINLIYKFGGKYADGTVYADAYCVNLDRPLCSEAGSVKLMQCDMKDPEEGYIRVA